MPAIRTCLLIVITLLLALFIDQQNLLQADGPSDNIPTKVRKIPRLGIEVSTADRKELQAGLDQLQKKIAQLKQQKAARVIQLLPDVEIFQRAVHDALVYQEFFAKRDVQAGKRVLQAGLKRADDLLQGKAPWTTQAGPVVRGYRSELDDTVQPYGLVIPSDYTPGSQAKPLRCDLWFHGRGETLSEVNFIDQRMRQVGRLKAENRIVLHPYGRYSNAFKFAGEVDVLESLNATKQHYHIDENRIAVRGFSMGGAGCWQMAVHYPDLFFAANPGAGFSETPEFLKFFQKETLHPTWFEKKLWQWYDCPGYAINLYHCPTVAYSGEFDTQKQAADVMEQAMKDVGIDMLHLIGPGMKHQIHPKSAIEIDRRLTSLAKRGRNRVPRNLHFATYTLKYNHMHWLTVNGLKEHWRQARVDGHRRGNTIKLKTGNVTEITLSFNSGDAPFDLLQPVTVNLNGQSLVGPKPKSDYSWTCRFHRDGGTWKMGALPSTELKKQHNLQGPVDDALMSRFLFVKPTGSFQHAQVKAWVTSELQHAQVHWRQQFRGVARTKQDNEITDADIAESNLILWGDPSSNSLLKKIIDKLPITWDKKLLTVGEKTFDAAHHAPVLIFPNPLNPKKYVVLNSSFTYREFAYLNNARQVPMLPDWSIIDLRTPAGSQFPGKIVEADFFDEEWKLR